MATIDALFNYLIEHRGSDLHLSEGQPPKIRVHGSVTAIPGREILVGDTFKNLLAEICEPNTFAHYLNTGDLDFASEMTGDSPLPCHSEPPPLPYPTLFRSGDRGARFELHLPLLPETTGS